VGLATGLAIVALERAVSIVWEALLPHITPVTVVLFPTIGLLLSGLALQFLTVNPNEHGTEEYIAAYHERGGRAIMRSFPGKVLAAFATLASGGSAGMEGPSIYIGGALGSFLTDRARGWSFTPEDIRQLAVAGAAAGISAVFKAPLTGIIFALEVPYRDDLARQALVPSLISSVTAYLVLVQFTGVKPLFAVAERLSLRSEDLFYAVILGLVVGLLARLFALSFHALRQFVTKLQYPLWAKTAVGGLGTGLFGLMSLMIFGTPAALGTGYVNVATLLTGGFGPMKTLALLVLKGGATLCTLGFGAAGGIFIPMIVLGASIGSFAGEVLPGAGGPLFAIAGMSAFLAAGYSTPLAAAVFVTETTGGAGYLIPALIAAAVAYAVSGQVSVSDAQRWRRKSSLDRLMETPVRGIMTPKVIAIDASTTIEEFVSRDMVLHRHKSMPVVDAEGRLVGMASLTDVQSIAHDRWTATTVGSVASRDLLTTVPDAMVGELVADMAERDIDRVPVVSPEDSRRLEGILSSTDILNVDRVLDE